MATIQETHSTVSQTDPAAGSKRPRSPPSPQLKIEPASEWANHTNSGSETTANMERTANTSGPELPGGYPYTPSTSEPGPSFEEIRDTAKEYLCAAGQYVPSQDDVMRMAQNAGTTVRGYIPDGVAAYLGPPQSTQEPVAASPIEESETTPTAAGSFVLINRGNNPVTSGTRGRHEAKHEFEAGQSAGAGLRTIDVKNIPPVPSETATDSTGDQANSNAGTKTQPGSLVATSRMEGMNGSITPFTCRAETAGGDAQIRTVLIPPGTGNGINAYSAGEGMIQIYTRVSQDLVKIERPKDSMNPRAGVDRVEGTLTSPKAGSVVNVRASNPLPVEVDANGEEGHAEMEKEGESFSAPKSIPENKIEKEKDINEPKVSSMVATKGSKQESTKNPCQIKQDDTNTKPRTRPPGERGSEWKGVLLDGKYQANLDKDEDLGLMIGGSKGFSDSGVRIGASQEEGDDGSVMKTNMNKVYSSTATTGHDEDTSESPTAIRQPRFTQSLPSQIESIPGRAQDHSVEQQRRSEHSERPHDSSVLASDMKETGVGKAPSPVQGGRQGRRKGSFLTRFKSWSKRLRQDKKRQNETIGDQ